MFWMENKINKIRDLFKVKLFTIRSETKKKREREQDFKYLLTLILTGGHKRERERERERDFKYLLTQILTGGHK